MIRYCLTVNYPKQVRSSSLWAEAPDLPGLSEIVVILLGQVTSPSLWLISRIDIALERSEEGQM